MEFYKKNGSFIIFFYTFFRPHCGIKRPAKEQMGLFSGIIMPFAFRWVLNPLHCNIIRCNLVIHVFSFRRTSVDKWVSYCSSMFICFSICLHTTFKNHIWTSADGSINLYVLANDLQRKKEGDTPLLVWDLDSSLPYPSPLTSYVSETFQPSFQLFSEYQRWCMYSLLHY